MQNSNLSRKEIKTSWKKNREDVVGGSSVVFTRKAVVETFIRKSTNLCKSIVGVDASQLYPYSMCQPMQTGLYTRWDLDSETSRLIPRQNRTSSFENMVMSYFQRTRPECEIESFLQQADRRKLIASVWMGFVLIAQLCLKPWIAFTASALVKRCLLLSLKRIFNVVAKRRSSMH